MTGKPEPLLSVRGLSISFERDGRRARAADGVSLDIFPGETLALVGESGSGKTVSALGILRLIPEPPGRIEAGEVLFRGRDVLRLPPRELRALRGKEIALVFQDPMTSLNPVFTVGEQIAEAVRTHGRATSRSARARAVELLERVGIASPRERAACYPHQLSGGMKQRAMIAMALACEPALLIADEPTTALDVTVEAQIIDLLRTLIAETRLAVLLITHDMGVVAELADRVAVMYAGRIVEEAPAGDLFDRPLHPYTVGLFASLPRLHAVKEPLRAIPGDVPDLFGYPAGCRFHPRCPLAVEACSAAPPPLVEAAPGRRTACIRAEGGKLPPVDFAATPAAGGR
jgi:peptide/nickel transport system ATP-binding protein/oligopeptide transport system ATP-binding protein